jgi:hypothetical protein
MTTLIEAAREINDFLEQQGWRYCVVGGIALSRWGEVRATEDVDLCLLTGLSEERKFIDVLLQHFAARVSRPAEFAELNRVLLISAGNDVGIDVALAWTPFEERMIDRATPFSYAPNLSIPTASAEDLVVTKAFAARPQDWIDVRGILMRQKGKLDWDDILRELSPLCELKEAPEIVDQLLATRVEVDAE